MGFYNMRKIISLIFVLLLSVSFVASLGVSSPYWDTKPLKMYVGESRQVAFMLVNNPEGETIKASVTLINDGGIAEILSGEDYIVKPGEVKNIRILINVPENAKIGNSYDVEFKVSGSSGEEGQVPLTVGYNKKFPVEVVKKAEASSIINIPKEKGIAVYWFFILGIIIIALLAAIVLTLNKRK
jgi:hypothetical protein